MDTLQYSLQQFARRFAGLIGYPVDETGAPLPMVARPLGTAQIAEPGARALAARAARAQVASGAGHADFQAAAAPAPDSVASRLASLMQLPWGVGQDQAAQALVRSLLDGTGPWLRSDALAELASAWVGPHNWSVTDVLMRALITVCKPSNANMVKLCRALWATPREWGDRAHTLMMFSIALWIRGTSGQTFNDRRLKILGALLNEIPEVAGAIAFAWANCVRAGRTVDYGDFDRFVKDELPKVGIRAFWYFWAWSLDAGRHGKLEQAMAQALKPLRGNDLRSFLARVEELLPGSDPTYQLEGENLMSLRSVLHRWATSENEAGRREPLRCLKRHFLEPIPDAPVPEVPAAATGTAARGVATSTAGAQAAAASPASPPSVAARVAVIAQTPAGPAQDKLCRELIQGLLDDTGTWLRPDALSELATAWVRCGNSAPASALMQALIEVCNPGETRMAELIRALWAAPCSMSYCYYAVFDLARHLTATAPSGDRDSARAVALLAPMIAAIPDCAELIAHVLVVGGRETEAELQRFIRAQLPTLDQYGFVKFWVGCFRPDSDERVETLVANALFGLNEQPYAALLQGLVDMLPGGACRYRCNDAAEARLVRALYRWAMREFMNGRYEPMDRLVLNFAKVSESLRLTEILDRPTKQNKPMLRAALEWAFLQTSAFIIGLRNLPAASTDQDKVMALQALYDGARSPYAGLDMEARIRQFLKDVEGLSAANVPPKLQGMILQVWLMVALPQTPEQRAKLGGILTKLKAAGRDARQCKDPVFEAFGRPLEQLRKYGQSAGVFIAPWNVRQLRGASRSMLRDFGVGSAAELVDAAGRQAASLDAQHLNNLVELLIVLCREGGEGGALDEGLLIAQLWRVFGLWNRAAFQWGTEDDAVVLDRVGRLMTVGRPQWAELYTRVMKKAPPVELAAAAAPDAPVEAGSTDAGSTEVVPADAGPAPAAPASAAPEPATAPAPRRPARPAPTLLHGARAPRATHAAGADVAPHAGQRLQASPSKPRQAARERAPSVGAPFRPAPRSLTLGDYFPAGLRGESGREPVKKAASPPRPGFEHAFAPADARNDALEDPRADAPADSEAASPAAPRAASPAVPRAASPAAVRAASPVLAVDDSAHAAGPVYARLMAEVRRQPASAGDSKHAAGPVVAHFMADMRRHPVTEWDSKQVAGPVYERLMAEVRRHPLDDIEEPAPVAFPVAPPHAPAPAQGYVPGYGPSFGPNFGPSFGPRSVPRSSPADAPAAAHGSRGPHRPGSDPS